KLPVLLENQQRGNYRVHLDPSDQGADVGLFCNQSYDKDAEIAKWLSTRNFRIALSHGIDRQQINEVFVLGLGQTGSAAPGERTPYFPGPEYKTLHAAYDVKKANEHQIYFETQWGADNIYGHFPLMFPAQDQSPLGPLYGVWFSSAGAKGKQPPPRMRELMAIYRRSFGVPDAERTRLAKEVWKI